MNNRHLLITITLVVLALIGCSKDHLDPTQIGRFRPVPAVNVILDSLGVAEEGEGTYEGAEEPKPSDILSDTQDYVFSSGDMMRVSIFELLQEGQPYVEYFAVNESGNISIPEIGQIQAAGLTESQLEDELKDALSPGILKNPTVTIMLQSSISRSFAILGDGIASPGKYPIPRYDFRLLDALAMAGSARQFNVSYIYVTRRLTGQEKLIEEEEFDTKEALALRPVEAGQSIEDNQNNENQLEDNQEEMLELIQPVFSATSSTGLVIASAEMATEEQLEALAIPEEVGDFDKTDDVDIQVGNVLPEPQQQGRVEWVFRDGKWVPIQVNDSGLAEPRQQNDLDFQAEPEFQPEERDKSFKPKTKPAPEDHGWDDIQSGSVGTRVIRIPKDKLYGGDPRYNIVIKPQDTITIHLDVVGEFYVLGNVNRQGIVNMSGRPMTLKMAIAAAGGLGQLAWPKKCEVVRRIGERKEEIVMVDLEKIANGTQPDFFIKPNDIINVGTHGISRWLETLREAPRAYYGFGFMYERNFADRDYYTHRPIPTDLLGL